MVCDTVLGRQGLGGATFVETALIAIEGWE